MNNMESFTHKLKTNVIMQPDYLQMNTTHQLNKLLFLKWME